MTFIASVVSKEGVAVIADSFSTSTKSVLEFNEFNNYLKTKPAEAVEVGVDEIAKLFTKKPFHTKDYEDKLYQYDRFTAITTAGAAYVNGRKIKEIIHEAAKKLKPAKKDIKRKVSELKSFLESEIKSFLMNDSIIYQTILLVTHFKQRTNKTLIFRMVINPATNENLATPDFEFVTVNPETDGVPVVCEGHNKVSERLLMGPILTKFELLSNIVHRIGNDFNIDKNEITDTYIAKILDYIATKEDYDDAKMYKLSGLSLQQAVDLACLLMRIEMDIQKYTENVPTVGGVIKLAVIDSKGFRCIAGDEIVNHENFYSH